MKQENYLKNLEVPKGKIDVVLDTDAYNEIDDQFAIAYMLNSGEKLNVKALYSAPFYQDYNPHSTSPKDGMEKSFLEIKNILTLMKREDLKPNVYHGSDHYLLDENTPTDSEAARHLCDLAMHYTEENPLYVVGIGAATNIASALLINPEICNRTVIVWLGGHSHDWSKTDEFNMSEDPNAARVILKSKAPLIQVPCFGVCDTFSTTKQELNYWLKGKNDICDYLVNHTVETAEKYAKGKVWSRVIWDVVAVAWLLNDNQKYLFERIEEVQIPDENLNYIKFDKNRIIKYIYGVKRDDLMRDLFDKLSR